MVVSAEMDIMLADTKMFSYIEHHGNVRYKVDRTQRLCLLSLYCFLCGSRIPFVH
jgi:hypothetical protein